MSNIKVSRDDKAWEVEVRAEISADAMGRYRDEALKEMQKNAKLDGFRPGKAPLERIISIYGESAIMRAAAEHAIQGELPELFAAQNLLIIDTPRVSTETPAAGKPLPFSARASLAPEVKLPDYKKLAAKVMAKREEISVSDKEHADALAHLKRERARIERVEAGVEAKKAAEEARALAEAGLPALDDEFVKGLGYESADKFSEALRDNLKSEKERQAIEKKRAELLDELVAKATIRYPALLRTYELNDMEARMKADVEQMGLQLDAYLTQAKKTREELRKEWEEPADKRAKVRLLLTEIARTEKIEPDAERLEHEIKHAKEHYPDANDDTLRAHIAHALRNEAVIAFLESQT